MHDGIQFVKQCRYQDRQIARHFISIEKKNWFQSEIFSSQLLHDFDDQMSRSTITTDN